MTHAGSPADKQRTEGETGAYAGLPGAVLEGLSGLEPSDFDPIVVADAIVKVVDAPFGKWPIRVELMLRRMAARFVDGVADRVSTEMFRRVCLKDLLEPRLLSDPRQ